MFGSGEKARENKGERKMGWGGGNVIFLRLVQQRKLKGGKIREKTSHLGPQKFISPNREENRGEKKLQSWNDAYTPLDFSSESRSAKSLSSSLSPYAVHQNLTPSTSPPTKSHAVDFATHKISHRHPQNLTPLTSPPTKFHIATHKISHRWLRHPQNFTSPPTKSHRSPLPPTKSCFLFLWCPLYALVAGTGYETMGRRKVDMNGFFICLFLFFYMCKCVQQFLYIYIYNLFYLIGKVKNLLNLYVEFCFL